MENNNIYIDDKYNYKFMEITREYNKEKEIPKSVIQIGNLKIYVTKKFNWFNKLMIRLIFGFKIKDCGGNDLQM